MFEYYSANKKIVEHKSSIEKLKYLIYNKHAKNIEKRSKKGVRS